MLKGFKVIELYGNASDSTVSITNKYFKFNSVTADELKRPSHVRFLIDTDTKRFAIEVCDADDRNAVKFPSPNGELAKRAVLNVTNKPAHEAIRRLMGWFDDKSYRVRGVAVPESNAIIYNLTQASEVKRYWDKDKTGGSEEEE